MYAQDVCLCIFSYKHQVLSVEVCHYYRSKMKLHGANLVGAASNPITLFFESLCDDKVAFTFPPHELVQHDGHEVHAIAGSS